MARIYVKRVFPAHIYSLRSVKLYLDGKLLHRLSEMEEYEISFHNPGILKTKLDLYSDTANLQPKDGEEQYYWIKYRGRTPLANLFYSFTPRALQLISVEKEVFKSADSSIYSTYTRAADNPDKLSYFLNLILGVFFLVQGLLTDTAELIDALFYAGLLGLITSLTVYFGRKNIALWDANLRFLICALVYAGVLAYCSSFNMPYTWLLFLPVLTLLVRTSSGLFIAAKPIKTGS